jgi:hypothetical protein
MFEVSERMAADLAMLDRDWIELGSALAWYCADAEDGLQWHDWAVTGSLGI